MVTALSATLAVALLGAPAAHADPPACSSGTPSTFLQASVGGDGNAIHGGYYLADGFTAQGSSITRMTVWMDQAANAATTLSVIAGDAIGGTVVGTATIASGLSGEVSAEPSAPIPVTPGERYILKVSAPAATQGRAEMIPVGTAGPWGGIYVKDGSNGNTDYRHSGWRMAMGVDFCGAPLGVATCSVGAPSGLQQLPEGDAANSIRGAYYAGERFVARGSSIASLSAWIDTPTDGPVRFSVIAGTAIDGPVVGTATAPGGATGQVTAVPDAPIPVTVGATYILKVQAPTATAGTALLVPTTGGHLYVRDGSNGGGDYVHAGWKLAMTVGFCGARLITDAFPPTSGAFGSVHTNHVAAQSFSASDASLHEASIWMTEANNGPLELTIHRDTPSGARVATATLAAGSTGKRSVAFDPPARLTPDDTYVLRVGAGSVETNAGAVAKRATDASQQGYDESGPVADDMALELAFGPALPGGGDMRAEQCSSTLTFPAGYVGSVETALGSKLDVWGNALITTPEGPTYDNVKDLLLPLRNVGSPAGAGGTQLTDSGVFYLPFGPPGTDFSTAGALHVADGSQVISRRTTGRSATFYVGATGSERFGLCEARLEEPALADGYQPVLETAYVDEDGVEFRHQSFVAHLPGTSTAASFVRITAEKGSSGADATELRIDLDDSGLTASGGALTAGGSVYAYYAGGASLEGGSRLRWNLDISDGQPHSVYLVRPVSPSSPVTFSAGSASHGAALGDLRAAWDARLATGATFDVPEPRVMDAQRNLLIQNLQLGWRYSYGNNYETFYQPESSSAVHRLVEYGFAAEGKAGLEALLPMTKGSSYPNWERGEKLSHAAAYWFLTGDDAFITANSATYEGYMSAMAGEIDGDPNGLLPKEFEGGDIPTLIYGAHTQTVGWRGMRDMALVWRLMGETALADEYEPIAAAFRTSLLAAIDSSKVTVGSGTFVPHDLLSGEQPFDPITGSLLGSYWNLLNPYLLGSGIVSPGTTEAGRLWSYVHQNGGSMLGLVRFNYYPTPVGSVTPNGLPGYQTSGDDNVYGVERSRFLAAQDEPDQLVLALYGKLAHGMTRKTFVSGEGHSIGPVEGEYFRSMYLPPSNANNDFFLVTLREMLLHVRETAAGVPDGLRLAHSTPRGWLADGKRIEVADAPTPFGDVGYVIDSRLDVGELDVSVDLPSSPRLDDTRLRLRLPAGHVIDAVSVVGGGSVPFSGDTVDLSALSGSVALRVETS